MCHFVTDRQTQQFAPIQRTALQAMRRTVKKMNEPASLSLKFFLTLNLLRHDEHDSPYKLGKRCLARMTRAHQEMRYPNVT